MKKILSICLVITIVFTIGQAFGEELTRERINEILHWKSKDGLDYQVPKHQYNSFLYLQVWKLADYVERCVEEVNKTSSNELRLFVIADWEMELYEPAVLGVEDIKFLFKDDVELQKMSCRIGSMKLHIDLLMAEKDLLLVANGRYYEDGSWFVKLVTLLGKIQTVLDKNLYLPQYQESYDKLWN